MWICRLASPKAVVTGSLFLGLGVLGCTPLGGWLYSDPTFALSGVRTTYQGSPADTLQVVLTGCNLNDFNVDGLTIDGQLFVDGTLVGVLQSDKAFTMKMRDSVDVMVFLQIPRAEEPRVHAKGDDYLTARYELNGRVEVATPIGVRRVALLQKGDVRFDSTGMPSGWTVRNARPCKPGQSVLPGQSLKPRTLVDTMFRPEPPVVGSPNQQNNFEFSSKPLTYATYLKVDELLALQQPLSDGPEHDEMLFIVIHQVYELWFKQILHEVGRLHRLLEAGDGLSALGALKRILTILKVLVSQIDVLETMTPLEFLSFRDRLESGSGFQSFQFREFEFALGHKQRTALERYAAGSAHRTLLERRFAAATLWDGFLAYLAHEGAALPAEALTRDVTQPITASEAVQAVLVGVYRKGGLPAQVCERLVDLDEGVQEWRYRHVKMVQRTIGTKRGTGGSDGAEYLLRTLNIPLYPDLWAIRAQL